MLHTRNRCSLPLPKFQRSNCSNYRGPSPLAGGSWFRVIAKAANKMVTNEPSNHLDCVKLRFWLKSTYLGAGSGAVGVNRTISYDGQRLSYRPGRRRMLFLPTNHSMPTCRLTDLNVGPAS